MLVEWLKKWLVLKADTQYVSAQSGNEKKFREKMQNITHFLISSNIQQATLFKHILALLDELISFQPRPFVLKAEEGVKRGKKPRWVDDGRYDEVYKKAKTTALAKKLLVHLLSSTNMHAIKQLLLVLWTCSHCLNDPCSSANNFINVTQMVPHKSFCFQSEMHKSSVSNRARLEVRKAN